MGSEMCIRDRRYLFSINGDSLIANAVGQGAIRDTASAIATQIESLKP